VRHEPLSRSPIETSSAVASRCNEDKVGMAFSFSIFDTYVRGTCIRSASWRWLSPDFCLNMRIAAATCSCEWLPLAGASTGGGAARIGSGSSSSSDVRHFLQRLLVVLNWTRWQWSHRTTSRESTGASAVAIFDFGVPEQASLQKSYCVTSPNFRSFRDELTIVNTKIR